jgi:hypothetical protein
MMWTLEQFPKTVKIEVTVDDLRMYGPTEAFCKACENVLPNLLYKPSLRKMELSLFDKETVEVVAVYKLPEIARSLFAKTYRPQAVTLYMGRLRIR